MCSRRSWKISKTIVPDSCAYIADGLKYKCEMICAGRYSRKVKGKYMPEEASVSNTENLALSLEMKPSALLLLAEGCVIFSGSLSIVAAMWENNPLVEELLCEMDTLSKCEKGKQKEKKKMHKKN